MTKVAFRRGASWDAIEVDLPVDNSGLAAEISQVLLGMGGEPEADSIRITPLALRKCGGELGVILGRYGAAATYDSSVRALLQTHLDEVDAREEAGKGLLIDVSELNYQLKETRFDRPLTSNQERDLSRLLALRHGANFSVPGAGKTTALLAIYEFLRSRGVVDRLLVVGPKNAFGAWEEEIGECFKREAPVIRRIAGGKESAQSQLMEDPEVCLITYQFLINVQRLVAEWAHQHRTHVVLDEAHRIKAGPTGVYSQAALSLSSVAARRDILTGTPLPQSPEDLRSQFDFLWPGQRILPEGRIDADPSDSALADLQGRVGPLYVRTTKAQLKLPPLDVRPIAVPLGPIQREIYELLRSEARRMASGMAPQDRQYFRALGKQVVRLLEAASNPLLLAQQPVGEEEEGNTGSLTGLRAYELIREFARRERPAKLVAAVERAKAEISAGRERKVLIWSCFIQNILQLSKMLSEFNPVVLYGAVGTGDEDDPETREGRIKKFHVEDACRVMIANPAACGEAISLHRACHYAIYVDRTFNAAHFLQSVDRIHRLGLKPDQRTRVEVLEAAWTIDARVANRMGIKIGAMSQILNDPGLASLAYDPEDLVEDFPGGMEPADVSEIVDHLVNGEKESRE